MRNPLIKDNDNSLVIAAAAIGAIAVGAIAYLYATRKGFTFRKKLSSNAEEGHEKATQYLEKKARKLKKKTTGLHEIEEIVKGQL